ncbi:hypothetical protein VHEMI07549 [[Torrubiella] hemipterigena]|uniref:3-carboxymuconate cyclase n=1 Tax=[Torrubiella] hemipterigena TaxID=1531966 RepID=A0A0A1T3V3_9HYPO|nr:hypothetical protein VHEMI07549 [[Torrubiella] hemipterigena]
MPSPSASATLCLGLLAASGLVSAMPNMPNMQPPAPATVTVTVSANGCAPSGAPAPAAPPKVVKVDNNALAKNATLKVGKAIYLITNGERNSVVALRILPDGTLSGGSSTPSGQKGGTGTDGSTKKPAAKDGLFSQSALTIAGNNLFAVNAGSNTVSMFNIDPNDVGRLTQVGRPVSVPGDFPNTIAATSAGQIVCVGMTGAKAGISCANFGRKGVGRMDNLRKFDLNQTNPPVGPTNTVSQLFFSGKHLFATVKGDPEKKNLGFLDAFEIQNRDVKRNSMYPGAYSGAYPDASKAKDADADKAKEEADKKAKEEAEKNKDEQDKKNKEEQDKKNKEEQDKKNKEEQDKKNKEEQDKKKKEEDDKKKKEEDDKKKKEEEDKKKKEEEDKKKKDGNKNKGKKLNLAKKLSTTEIKSVINGTAVLFGAAPIPGTGDIFATDASFGAVILGTNGEGRATLKHSTKIDKQKATCWVTISGVTRTAFVTDVAAARIVEMSVTDGKVLGEIDVTSTNATGLIDLKAAGGFLYALAPGDGKIPSQVIVVDVKGGAKGAKIVQKVDLGIFGGVNTIQGMAILQ